MKVGIVIAFVFAAWVWTFALTFISQYYGAQVSFMLDFTLKTALVGAFVVWVHHRTEP